MVSAWKFLLIDAATLRRAEQLIESCEDCNEEDAEIQFDNIPRSCNVLRSECDGTE
jgi:hypothetical protein